MGTLRCVARNAFRYFTIFQWQIPLDKIILKNYKDTYKFRLTGPFQADTECSRVEIPILKYIILNMTILLYI